MGDRPALLSLRRHQHRLVARGRHFEHKLVPQAPNRLMIESTSGFVLPGLELDDAGLRDAQLLRQCPLAQFALSAITQQRCRKLPRRGEPLPLRSEARVGKLLLAKRASETLGKSSSQ